MRSKNNKIRLRKKRIFKLTKGFFGPRNQFRIARKALLKSIQNKKISYKLNLRKNGSSNIILLNSALSKVKINYNEFMRINNITLKLHKSLFKVLISEDEDLFYSIVKYIILLEKKNV